MANLAVQGCRHLHPRVGPGLLTAEPNRELGDHQLHEWLAFHPDRRRPAEPLLQLQQQVLHHPGDGYGGVAINIDGDYVDLVSGTPQPPSACDTVSLDFTAYPALASGATGNEVTAAQCLLKNAGHPASAGDPTGTFDAETATATTAFQNAVGLPATGSIDSHTWTALLAVGTTPTLREGATGVDVRRLQRSLTAALGRTVAIDGQFGPNTTQAARDYQTATGLAVDGVVGPATWTALQTGK